MNITFRNDRWVVAMSWSESQEAYEDGSPTERAILAVADRHDATREQLRSSTIRTSGDGMVVVVESND
jgi:hypothetical protein